MWTISLGRFSDPAHKFTRPLGRTSSPLRSGLSFRYAHLRLRLATATSPNCARAWESVDPMQQLPVMDFVSRGHPVCREALFEASADAAPIDPVDVVHGLNRFAFRLDDKACHSVLNYLRHRPGTIGDDRRAACHGFDHDKTEGFRPV